MRETWRRFSKYTLPPAIIGGGYIGCFQRGCRAVEEIHTADSLMRLGESPTVALLRELVASPLFVAALLICIIYLLSVIVRLLLRRDGGWSQVRAPDDAAVSASTSQSLGHHGRTIIEEEEKTLRTKRKSVRLKRSRRIVER